jgi:hypothetical protein
MLLIYIKNNEENGGNSNRVTDRYWPFIIWEWSSRRTILYISIYVYEIWPRGILCRWHLKIFKRHMHTILQIFDLSHIYLKLLILANCSWTIYKMFMNNLSKLTFSSALANTIHQQFINCSWTVRQNVPIL